MDEYTGPKVIRMARGKTSKLSQVQIKRKEDTQFSQLPDAITDPMEGFVTITPRVNGFFSIPDPTQAPVDEPYLITALYVPVPHVKETLRQARLDADKYTLDEIKSVLQLHGISVPRGVTRKAQYADLARSSGVVSNI